MIPNRTLVAWLGWLLFVAMLVYAVRSDLCLRPDPDVVLQLRSTDPLRLAEQLRADGYSVRFVSEYSVTQGRALLLTSSRQSHQSTSEFATDIAKREFPPHTLLFVTEDSELNAIARSCRYVSIFRFGKVLAYTVDPKAIELLRKYIAASIARS